DVGTNIIAAGTGMALDAGPQDLALDAANRIYTIQQTLDSGSALYRVFRFPPYTESGIPETTNVDWKIGTGDDSMEGAYGIAVDPTGRYVAVAFIGNGLD